jgi:F-box/WD-40 domain protein 7
LFGDDMTGGATDALALCGSMVVTRSAASGAGSKWREGPANSIIPVQEWTSVKHGHEVRNSNRSGRVVDVSDRNVMCMSVLGEKAVLGSADHGLKELNIRSGQVLRTLYTKRCGHTEWVTTVSHCPDGRVISGGMDSKLCLWNASGAVCVDLTGHMGSVSRVRTHAHQNYAISSSYDRTLRCWDLRSKTEAACCTGHDAPILEFIWADAIVASGDRSGVVRLWDALRAQYIGKLSGHKGHITAMMALPESCSGGGANAEAPAPGGTSGGSASMIATGAQDGHIRIWDLRQKLNTFNMMAHPGGAVNEIGVTLGSSPPVLVSAGADGRLLVLDPRAGYQPLYEFAGITEDFIYSLLVLDDIAYTGDGRGKVTCFDVRGGKQQYVLDAGDNGIRCMGASENTLICAGDDGNAVMFDF